MTVSTPVLAPECEQIFASLAYLNALSPEDCAALAPLIERQSFVAGSTIFYEDDDSDAVLFLISGGVEVFKSDDDGKKLPLMILRDGGVLGEIGLLTGTTRTATARALTSAEVLVISAARFNEALENGHLAALRLSLAFARILAGRLADTNALLFRYFAITDVLDFMRNIGTDESETILRV